MSGPLASWVAEHSRASHRGRAVLVQLALVARHDGTATSDLTFEQLQHRTGMGRSSVAAGAAELRRLGEAKVVEQGGGRHRPTRYFVPAVLCSQECWACSTLAQATRQTVRHTDGLEGKRTHKKPSTKRKKQSTVGPKQSATRTHLRDGDGTPPSGGTVTHPESNNRSHDGDPLTGAVVQAQASEEPFNRMLPWLDQIRRYDPKAQLLYGSSPLCYRLSPAWARRGGEATLLMDEEPVAKWLAWAAEQVAAEQAQMQAASRHRLANPVPLAVVLDEVVQERSR